MTATASPRKLNISPLLKGNLRVELDVPQQLQILEQGQAIPAGHNIFRIMHPDAGDERLTWDSEDWASIKEAKQMFLALIEKGLQPFRVGADGKKSNEIMKEFDPRAEDIIFVPMAVVAGG